MRFPMRLSISRVIVVLCLALLTLRVGNPASGFSDAAKLVEANGKAVSGKSADLIPINIPSLLDEVGRLAHPVKAEEFTAYRDELAATPSSLHAAQLHLWLGERELGANEEPHQAILHFREALRLAPATEKTHGRALYNIAVTHFRQGAYRKAADEFSALLRAPVTNGLKGYDRVNCALFLRHASACAGYHAERSKMGIPEPPQLDPECGVAGLAVCLRGLGLRYDEATVRASMRVTGLGSNFQDILDACGKIGQGEWVTGRAISSDATGLKVLPLPMVAFIEHDHFVSVTRVDDRGVTYVCSDCGTWPGGAVHLTWKQWQKLEPGLYLSVVRKGSPQDTMLTHALDPKQKKQLLHDAKVGVRVASASAQSSGAGTILQTARQMAQIAQHVVVVPSLGPGVTCGVSNYALHCTPGMSNCPMDAGGGGDCNGPSAGDPVNLATLEEEYTPEADISVYNSVGPRVSFGRIYNSLRSSLEAPGNGVAAADWPYDFGRGWSHSYNSYITSNGSTQLALVMPNKSRITFSLPAGTPSGSLLPVQAGAPFAITWTVRGAPYNDQYFTVLWKNGTRWKFYTSQLYGNTFAGVGGYNGSISAQWALGRIENIVGRGINLNYTTAAPRLLSTITNDNGQTLLILQRDPTFNCITSVTDGFGRNVQYTFAQTSGADGDKPYPESNTPQPELITVSQLRASGQTSISNRFTYGYTPYIGNAENQKFSFLTSITRPHPNYWDENGNGPAAVTATIEYDPATLFVKALVDANGNRRSYVSTVGSTQTQVTVSDPQSNIVYRHTVSFSSSMNQVSDTNGAGQALYIISYNAAMPFLPDWVDNNQGASSYFSYDSFGNITQSKTPPSTSQTTYRVKLDYNYDYSVPGFPFGLLTTTSYPNEAMPGTSVRYYGQSGQPAGPAGMPYRVYLPSGSPYSGPFYQYTYNVNGDVTQVLVPNSTDGTTPVSISYTADGSYSQPAAAGQPLSITDELGHTSHFRYDVRGNKIRESDHVGFQYDYYYNYNDTIAEIHQPATGQQGGGRVRIAIPYKFFGGPRYKTWLYDENNSLIRETTYSYGREGESTSTAGTSAEVTAQQYDALYRLRQLQDARGNVTSYNYYPHGSAYSGHLQSQVQQGRVTTYNDYDSMGRLKKLTDPNGVATDYGYDFVGRSTGYAFYGYSYQTGVQIDYDQFGRTKRIDSPYHTEEINDYNVYDQPQKVTTTYKFSGGTNPPSKTVNYRYNSNGSRRQMWISGSSLQLSLFYYYDSVNRLDHLTSANSNNTAETTRWTYYDNNWLGGQLVTNGPSVTSPGIYSTVWAYRQNGDPNDVGSYKTDGTLLSRVSAVVHNGAGQRFDQGRQGYWFPGGVRWEHYAFDNKGALTNESGTGDANYNYGYSYDAANNLTNFMGQSYSGSGYNANNQPTNNGDVYDSNGNPTSYATPSGTKSLVFDNDNRLSVAQGLEANVYRADGLRGWINTSAGGSRYFLYDGNMPIAEMDVSGNILATNVYGQTGLLSRRLFGATPSQDASIFYTFDERGNVASQMAANGQVWGGRTYTSYGTIISGDSNSGPPAGMPADTSPVTLSLGAQYGGLTDKATGMTLYGHRFYDSGRGRWLTQDPIGYAGGMNLYAYCGGDPINFIDPSGLDYWSDAGQFGLGELQGFGNFVAGSLIYDVRNHRPLTFGSPCDSEAMQNGSSFGEILATVGSIAAPYATAGKVASAARVAEAASQECFVAGTPVQMADGTTKPIEEVKAGDEVITKDQQRMINSDGSNDPKGLVVRRVVQTFITKHVRTLTVNLDNGEQVTTTLGHPFAVKGKGWVLSGRLVIGDSVYLRDGFTTKIISLKIGDTATVYNFEVQDTHTYFVGNRSGGLWVHNSSFVVTPNGDVIIIPKGSTGPVPVVNPAGNITGQAYTGGAGGHGLDKRADTVRIMDAIPAKGSSPAYPNGYVRYQNGSGPGAQGVAPYSGQTIPNAHPEAHIPLK